jgi:hypothetical protein
MRFIRAVRPGVVRSGSPVGKRVGRLGVGRRSRESCARRMVVGRECLGLRNRPRRWRGTRAPRRAC